MSKPSKELKSELADCGRAIANRPRDQEFTIVRDLYEAYQGLIEEKMSKEESIEILSVTIEKFKAARCYWWAKVKRLDT
jgi:hypothetical protein